MRQYRESRRIDVDRGYVRVKWRGVTEAGPIEITVPRDRDGSFEPKIVRKR